MTLLSLSEAAAVLGLEPGTLRVQIHNGKLRGRKVGPIWTVTEREVERYRTESLRGSTGEEVHL
jgi:excisionase family DNA binding protein